MIRALLGEKPEDRSMIHHNIVPNWESRFG